MLTRRTLLQRSVAGAALGVLDPRALAEAAAETSCPAGATLADVEHIVILMQENRSFDHYFGSYRGVRGFDDHPRHRLGAFSQAWGHSRLLPFHLDTADQSNDAECGNDIDHSWPTQHLSWNHGANDAFVKVHEQVDGVPYGTMAMGYYKRADNAFPYALADAFTICDHWHCSVFGPTYPNRILALSGTIDPDGRGGGPVVSNPLQPGVFNWETMPGRLQDAGISWKIYSQASANNNVLPYFAGYSNPDSPLAQNGVAPTWPADFNADVASGKLPQVSWVLAPMNYDEHPPAPIQWGHWVQSQVLGSLISNPEVWERTVMFITYDENGGFFDHVPPPVAPAGTPGEWVTVSPLPSDAGGIAGPIGLGFRVPGLVVSPFSRGGLVCSETFDHTSILRFIEARHGVKVPNLSAWRRSVTGDLTGALNLVAPPRADVPTLPSPALADQAIAAECGPSFAPGQIGATVGGANVNPYPVPAIQTMPTQEPGSPLAPEQVCDELAILVTGVGAVVGQELRARIRVTHTRPLTSVFVRLNGHPLVRSRAAALNLRVPARRLRHGRNTLIVVARETSGRTAQRELQFRHG